MNKIYTRIFVFWAAVFIPVNAVEHLVHPDYAYCLRNQTIMGELLNPTNNLHHHPQTILTARAQEKIGTNRLFLGMHGTVRAGVYQSNQIGASGFMPDNQSIQQSCASLHHDVILWRHQWGILGTLDEWASVFATLNFNPTARSREGSTTSVTTNLVDLEEGMIVIGTFSDYPLYVSLGKQATPFGLGSTITPHTPSLVTTSFAGRAYGGRCGYHNKHGVDVSCMIIQGGEQFRCHHSGDPTPTRLNNWAIDGSLTYQHRGINIKLGASHEGGSIFNHTFPISPATATSLFTNPAWSCYGIMTIDQCSLIAEIASTTKRWPGSYNPYKPLKRFKPSRVTAWHVGSSYTFDLSHRRQINLSASCSQLITGPRSSPWEQRSQVVLGIEYSHRSYIRFFSEYIHTTGYTPLWYLSGGNVLKKNNKIDFGKTLSNQKNRTNNLIAGIHYAF